MIAAFIAQPHQPVKHAAKGSDVDGVLPLKNALMQQLQCVLPLILAQQYLKFAPLVDSMEVRSLGECFWLSVSLFCLSEDIWFSNGKPLEKSLIPNSDK